MIVAGSIRGMGYGIFRETIARFAMSLIADSLLVAAT
jgi:hypothetical protein